MKKIIIVIVSLVILVVAYWLISPLFIKVTTSAPQSQLVNEKGALSLVGVGKFTDGASGHHSKGGLEVYSTAPNQYALRFTDDFEVTNGPDLFVYLGSDRTVLVGSLKGSVGSQNYILPVGIDPREFDSVVIWCRAFGVLFGSAGIHSVDTLQ